MDLAKASAIGRWVANGNVRQGSRYPKCGAVLRDVAVQRFCHDSFLRHTPLDIVPGKCKAGNCSLMLRWRFPCAWMTKALRIAQLMSGTTTS